MKTLKSTMLKGSETILLAEDDTAVLKVLQTILEEFDYKVIPAVNGKDAIDKFMQHRDSIQLLILDLVMPKNDGRKVFEEIKKVRPAIKTLFMSGYSMDIQNTKFVLEQGLNLITKPIIPHEFLKKVREVMGK